VTVNGPGERVRRRLKLSPSLLNAFTFRAAGVSAATKLRLRLTRF